MAVGVGYLAKIKRAVRVVSTASDIATELTDLIEECRADLVQLGVLPTKATDETDVLVLGAVRSFVRWKFAQDEKESQWNMADYMAQRDEMRRRTTYTVATDAEDPPPEDPPPEEPPEEDPPEDTP
jgi:hypothetical protein